LAGHAVGIREGNYTGFWWGKRRKRPLRRPRRRWENGVVRTGLIWLGIGPSGGLFWILQRTFGFHKILENSSVIEQLLVSQEGLKCTELVTRSWRSTLVQLETSKKSHNAPDHRHYVLYLQVYIDTYIKIRYHFHLVAKRKNI
jgi:hypothetical protein